MLFCPFFGENEQNIYFIGTQKIFRYGLDPVIKGEPPQVGGETIGNPGVVVFVMIVALVGLVLVVVVVLLLSLVVLVVGVGVGVGG